MMSKIRHDVNKFVMTSKIRHEVKKFVMMSNICHDVKMFVMTTKSASSQTDTHIDSFNTLVLQPLRGSTN